MTGFGRCLAESETCSQEWEVKSVNGRHLDIKWRLPVVAAGFGQEMEKLVRRHAQRGRIEISLSLRFAPGSAPRPDFNSQLANAMLDDLASLAKSRNERFAPGYAALLAVPSLWTEPETDMARDLAPALTEGLTLALADWNESRAREGAALGADLLERVARLEDWKELIAARAPEIKAERAELLRARLEEFLAASAVELDDNRYLQEIAILADRLDTSEELTRLSAHLERMRELLREGRDAGRKLDFTLQECFREINTLGNKLTDAQLSRVVVDFKNELEKCREQAQNLE